MSRSIWGGCAILMLAALLAGCGPAREDKLLKDQIAILEEVAAAFEKVTDKKSYQEVEPEIQALMAKIGEMNKELNSLGPERREAAMKNNALQFEQVMSRMKAAKGKAAKVAFK